ncbi:hypothetical protein Y032_0012g1675 [Ancylostoma ceylanicum]|uniref:Uncharacterized protein n=1 Tax=Ancylostoma ceylanicum TaxID=53326 RepID=A0A016VDI9_9BILA|nr:hypothetical protein Y032_0012g1675 [Ancylostoma ceylanicum]
MRRGLRTVHPKRRVRPSGRGGHACQQSTSSSLVCVSRFIVIFMISTNDPAVTWTAWADSSFRMHCKQLTLLRLLVPDSELEIA